MSILARIAGIEKDTFGLDIGYQSIKVIQLKKAGVYFKLLSGGTIPSPRDPFAKGRVSHKKELTAAIIKAIRDFHISAKAAISALPESMVFTKIIRMPKMSENELKNAVPLEAASFIPFEPAKTYIDFQIADQYENSYETLVIAAQKTLVDDIIETFNLANIELLCIETKPIANARALIMPKSQETVMILDVGARASSLTICEDVTLKFTATLSFGGRVFQDIISNVSSPSGETELLNDNKAVLEILNTLSEKVLEGIKYYQGRKGKRTISKILVVGGGAKMPGLAEHLTEKTKIKTELGNPWQLIKNPPKSTDTLQATTAIGLAMRQL